MELFSVIDDVNAIVKLPKGVQKQVKLYKRNNRVYVPHSGGFVEVRHKELHTDCWTTAHPDVKVLKHDAHPMFREVKDGGLAYMRLARV